MYTVYAVANTPEQMLAKYPNPALYEDEQIYLFGETLKQVSNIEPVAIVDLSEMVLTHYELLATIRGLVDNIDGVEIHLAHEQGSYLYEITSKSLAEGLDNI